MKIISNFKDYYDYVSTINGIDDHVVYVRQELKPSDKYKLHFSFEISDNCLIVDNLAKNFLVWPRNDEWHTRYLIVCGKQYLLVKRAFNHMDRNYLELQASARWEIFNPEKHNLFNKSSQSFSKFWWREKPKTLEYYVGSFHEEWVTFSRELQQPVFCVSSSQYDGRFFVETTIPRLADYHFGSIMSAEQLHQELEYFIGNTMRDNPDIVPPVNVSDKDLIIAKGFDIKKSFRKGKTKNG